MLIQEMLPQAFTKKSVTRALVMPELNLILVDSSSYSKAEELLALLRKALGSLPVIPLNYAEQVYVHLTDWVKCHFAPNPFETGSDCSIYGVDGEIIQFKNQYLPEEEVTAHIESGKKVMKLELKYGRSMSFIICSDGSLKRIKFSPEFMAANDEVGDVAARLDADFILCAKELRSLMGALEFGLGGYESLERE